MRLSMLFCLLLLAPASPSTAQQFDYDVAGRMTTATYPSGASINYEYDANSNVTRIRYAPAPAALQPPDGVIDLPTGDVAINAGNSVTFAGTGSDPDGALPLTYRWDFGGGPADSTEEDPGAVIFPTPGSYTVTLTVTDATNLADPSPDTVVVTVNSVPTTGGGGNSGGGGGGSVLILPMLLLFVVFVRRRRLAMTILLVAAGSASAQSWAPQNSGTTANLNDVWAAAPDAAYAVGDAGTVLYFDGTAWSLVNAGTSSNINAIWGVGPDDIYIVGNAGFVSHYDGMTWTTIDIGASSNLTDVWFNANGTIYIVGPLAVFSNDGSGWQRRPVTTFRDGVTLTPSNAFTSVKGVGNQVMITANPAFATQPGFFIDRVQEDVWDTSDVWIFDANNMIVVGQQSRLLKNGDPAATGTWDVIGIMERPLAVWGSAPDNIYAAGEIGNFGRISSYDGNATNSWTTELDVQFRTFNGIHGTDANTIFAVGTVGMIYRYSTPAAEPTTGKLPYADIAEDNVNTFTGELIYETQDFSIGNGRHPLQFNRYYGSLLSAQQTVGGDLGENWTHNYAWRIDMSFGASGDRIRVTDYKGRELLFDSSTQAFLQVSPTWAKASLSETPDYYLFADLATDRIYAFRKLDGSLEWIEDRNGNRHTLIYNMGFLASVNDGSNQISFEYDSANRITRAYAPGDGTSPLETRFSYSNGRLDTAVSPSNVQTSYSYTNGAYLTSVDRDGVSPKVWTYGVDNRVVTTDLTDGGSFNYAYGSNSTTVTEPGGTSREIIFDSEGRVTSIENGVGSITSYNYDANGNRSRVVDSLGRVTDRVFDPASGRVARITQPGGFITEYDYELNSSLAGVPFFDLIEARFPGNAREAFEYDSYGNVVIYTDALDNQWDLIYDASGQLIEVVNPAGGPMALVRSVAGEVLSTTDPNNNTTNYRYDSFQRLTQIEYPDGGITNLEYSSRFVPDRILDRSGSAIDFTFGIADQVQLVDYSNGNFETYSYDDAGGITAIETSGNQRTEYRYDAFRNISRVTAPDLTFEEFLYDAAGRLGRYVDAIGDVWDFEYAADDALIALVRPDLDRIDIGYSGDPRGLPTSFRNDNKQLQLTYNAIGQIASSVDQSEQSTVMTRNLRGEITQIQNQPQNTVRGYDYDLFGNAIGATDPLGAFRSRSFDIAGYLSGKTDALGNTTSFVRDTLNRIESITHADGVNVDIAYAASGQPMSIQGSDGTNVVLDSSPEGRILGGTQLVIGRSPDGKIVESNGIDIGYDSNDRVSTMTVAPGKAITYSYNGRGDVIQVRDWLGGVTNIDPTDVGNIDTLIYPNGITSDYEYDRAERIVSISFGSIGAITIQRDVFGRIENINHSWDQPTDFPSEDRRIAYDNASRIDGASYDARGNLVNDGRHGRVWNALDQLTEYEGDNGSVSLSYDALGNIVRLTSVGQDRAFVHNYALKNPRITIDRDAAGNDLWYYVHTANGRLLYRISGNDERQYFHFDANGNTVFITDDSGQVVQRYLVAPHGEVVVGLGGVENDRISKAETGGIQMDDSSTVLVGAGFIDSFSAHYLGGDIEDENYASIQLEFGRGRSSFSGDLDELSSAEIQLDARSITEAVARGDVNPGLAVLYVVTQSISRRQNAMRVLAEAVSRGEIPLSLAILAVTRMESPTVPMNESDQIDSRSLLGLRSSFLGSLPEGTLETAKLLQNQISAQSSKTSIDSLLKEVTSQLVVN